MPLYTPLPVSLGSHRAAPSRRRTESSPRLAYIACTTGQKPSTTRIDSPRPLLEASRAASVLILVLVDLPFAAFVLSVLLATVLPALSLPRLVLCERKQSARSPMKMQAKAHLSGLSSFVRLSEVLIDLVAGCGRLIVIVCDWSGLRGDQKGQRAKERTGAQLLPWAGRRRSKTQMVRLDWRPSADRRHWRRRSKAGRRW